MKVGYFKSCLIVFLITVTTVMSGCSVFGVRSTEEASFTLLLKEDAFELRRYDSVMAVQTFVEVDTFRDATDIAFRRLFNYIFGENENVNDIAMTAPVIASPSSMKTSGEGNKQIVAMTSPVIAKTGDTLNGWTLQFVLPKEFTRDTAPRPSNPDVMLIELSEKTVAIMRYSGLWDDELFESNSQRLKSWVEGKGYESLSLPYYAGYDPPWTLPFLRRNEVLIDLKNK